MQFDKDPSFRAAAGRSKARIRQRRLKLAGTGLVVLAVAGGAASWLWLAGNDPAAIPEDGDGFAMVPVAQDERPAIDAARTPFLDLPRDPLILTFAADDTHGKAVTGPDGLPPKRVGTLRPASLTLTSDDLVVRETALVTTIPSSRADLAFFQASRARVIAETPSLPLRTEPGQGEVVTVSGEGGSWGDLIGPGADTATFVETRIENTTSVVYSLREDARIKLYDDRISVLQTARALAEVLAEAGLTDAAAGQAAGAAVRLLEVPETLPAGTLVALRLRPSPGRTDLMQMTLFDGETYLGTLAQIGAGRFDTGADPWVGEDLLAQSEAVRPAAVHRDVRLLDALYSAAIRNGLPTTLVGELIVMMSQVHDLDRYAAEGDRVTILHSGAASAAGAGAILFAGIDGPSGKMTCYVVPDATGEGYRCAGQGGAAGGIGYGLSVPVAGTLTSGFGPRVHPVLHQARAHNGVDWAAPTGTPVRAAASGKVTRMGDGGGYGNVVYVDHADGMQTRYAHLSGFAPGLKQGATVAAGDLVGQVGTTGLSTGPHLHFELWLGGKPVDPLGAGTGDGAVGALVARIVTVESAGRADAANPLSTALGLGQFIEGTWLRMMRTYRPDLAAKMSRTELLALRTNPDLSREMIANLARENEAYLRANGQDVTAGRLYLAHFLGAEGAVLALRSDPARLVSEAMDPGVVRANPFLRGRTMGDLIAWADAKMTGTASRPAVAAISPADRAFMALIDTVLAEG